MRKVVARVRGRYAPTVSCGRRTAQSHMLTCSHADVLQQSLMQAKDRDNRLRINDGAVGHHLHGLLLRVQAYRGTWRLRADRGTVHLLESRRQIQRGVLRGEAGRVDESRELGELRSLVAGLLAQLAACNVQICSLGALAWPAGISNVQRWVGMRYCSTNGIFPSAVTARTPTVSPLFSCRMNRSNWPTCAELNATLSTLK